MLRITETERYFCMALSKTGSLIKTVKIFLAWALYQKINGRDEADIWKWSKTMGGINNYLDGCNYLFKSLYLVSRLPSWMKWAAAGRILSVISLAPLNDLAGPILCTMAASNLAASARTAAFLWLSSSVAVQKYFFCFVFKEKKAYETMEIRYRDAPLFSYQYQRMVK